MDSPWCCFPGVWMCMCMSMRVCEYVWMCVVLLPWCMYALIHDGMHSCMHCFLLNGLACALLLPLRALYTYTHTYVQGLHE
jgi:hypothetical protein